MKLTFRWYGEKDCIPLEYIKQIQGMTGVVTAVYDVPVGEVWPLEKLKRLKTLANGAGLENGKYHVRIRGIAGEKRGEWSHAYPVYVTGEKPHYPDGLRVVKNGSKYIATWGEVLGCGEYRLYKVGSKTPVYAGKERQAEVNGGEYFVTALNGNGESEPSLIRSTKCELAEWDNHPEKGFVRDPRSNEHGYAGFDFIGNKKFPRLSYPTENM